MGRICREGRREGTEAYLQQYRYFFRLHATSARESKPRAPTITNNDELRCFGILVSHMGAHNAVFIQAPSLNLPLCFHLRESLDPCSASPNLGKQGRGLCLLHDPNPLSRRLFVAVLGSSDWACRGIPMVMIPALFLGTHDHASPQQEYLVYQGCMKNVSLTPPYANVDTFLYLQRAC